MRVLLVEDEPQMAAALRSALGRHDMVIDHVQTLSDAEAAIASATYQAVLLDRGLPDGDGLSLIPRIRAKVVWVPVIVLTARGDAADRIHGLDSGADDYLPKPFLVEELLARLRAVVRRRDTPGPDVVRVGRLAFDVAHREASVGGVPMSMARRELLVLEALVRRAGRAVLREFLEETVYGFDDEITSNSLDAHVSRLRRKLETADAGVTIHAIRGVGYLLKATP